MRRVGDTIRNLGRPGVAAAMMLLLAGCGYEEGQSAPKHAMQVKVKTYLTIGMMRPKGGSSTIQSMIDRAAPDRVAHLPSGCYEITDPVRVPDGTTVMGEGPDRTILFRHPSRWKNKGGAMVEVRGDSARSGTRISGIGLVGVKNTRDKGTDIGVLLQDCVDFRVDNCYFEGIGNSAVYVRGHSRGVVDNCVFVDIFKRGINNLGYGVVVYGTDDWVDDPGLGTEKAVFVEDCELVGCRHAVASNAGAHYVFRHNRVWGNVVSTAVDAHGLAYGSERGTQCVEIYGNTIGDPVSDLRGIGIRGGSGVIFENEIRGYDQPIHLVIEWGTPARLKNTYPVQDQVQNLWIWDNLSDGNPTLPVVHEGSYEMVREGRDYFTDRKPGYVPFTYPHPLRAIDR